MENIQELNNYLHIDKPWGCFDKYTHNQQTTVKILTVSPNKKLSLQRHQKRSELWVPITGDAIIEINGEKWEGKLGEKYFIPVFATHRLSTANTEIKVLEISFGEFDESDIERLEDDFGRSHTTQI